MARSLPPIEMWNNTTLFEAAEARAAAQNCVFVLVTEEVTFGDFRSKWASTWDPWSDGIGPGKLVVLWTPPIDPLTILAWRSSLIEEHGLVLCRMLELPAQDPPDWARWLQEELSDWRQESPARETAAIKSGSLAKYRDPGWAGDALDPAFLTIPPGGPMGRILESLDQCKRQFRQVIGGGVGERRTRVNKELVDLVNYTSTDGNGNRIPKPEGKVSQISQSVMKAIRDNRFEVDVNRLPRVLLLGESGVGKTMIAKYLALRTSPGRDTNLMRPFKRIAIPEYLKKEENFEHDMFGYCEGAYTGALRGNFGQLLERIGGVVFFDEIGDASPEIQAKLLALLDQYLVTPRGWEGGPIPCPLLIVAGTNRPIADWAADEERESFSGRFRNDLLQRFTNVIRIPPLSERLCELDYIVDVLLQTPEFSAWGIEEIGDGALERLRSLNYTNRNFRYLRQVMKEACAYARADRRPYLAAGDIEAAKGCIDHYTISAPASKQVLVKQRAE